MFEEIKQSQGFQDNLGELIEKRFREEFPNHFVNIKAIIEELDPSKTDLTAQEIFARVQQHIAQGDRGSKVTIDSGDGEVLLLHMIQGSGKEYTDTTATIGSLETGVATDYQVTPEMYSQFRGIAVDFNATKEQIRVEIPDNIA